MRNIQMTKECLEFIEGQNEKFRVKLEYLVQVVETEEVVKSNQVKKLVNTIFYELRMKVENEYRIILFTIDHENFIESRDILFIYGFQKKSTKDYKRAVKKAKTILDNYFIKDEEE